LFTFGICFWLVYGVMIDSVPVTIANAITLVLSSIILYMKIMEKKGSVATGL
jgi:MtN3 and saliva related transmembrane protein